VVSCPQSAFLKAAYHESGHALVAWLLDEQLSQVSVGLQPNGAGGVSQVYGIPSPVTMLAGLVSEFRYGLESKGRLSDFTCPGLTVYLLETYKTFGRDPAHDITLFWGQTGAGKQNASLCIEALVFAFSCPDAWEAVQKLAAELQQRASLSGQLVDKLMANKIAADRKRLLAQMLKIP
jgi:hypothetical protein